MPPPTATPRPPPERVTRLVSIREFSLKAMAKAYN